MSDEREQALAGDDTATIAPLPVAPAVFTPIEEIAMPEVKRKNKWPLIITLIVMGGVVARCRLRILRCTLVFSG